MAAPPRLITSGHLDLWPCYSPDGSRVIFSRRTGDGWELLRASVEGGTSLKVAPSLPVAATRANWFRQGRIAFTGTSLSGENRIWLIESDGANPHELDLPGLSHQMFYPSWFPEGEQLVAMDGQELAVVKVDVRNGTVATLTDRQQVLAGMPSASPEGKAIVFAGQKNVGQPYDQSVNQLWLVGEDGVARPLETVPAQGRAPTWSPDGKRIAFESTRGSSSGLYAIFVINRDGTGIMKITDLALNADHPVWSPDGRHLAFSAQSSMGNKERGIGVVDVPDR